MDQLTIPFPTEGPIVASSSWGASVCQRVVLADGRTVYLHYEVTSHQPDEAPWTLHTVSVEPRREDLHALPVRYRLNDGDELPDWLRRFIQTAPKPRVVAAD